MTKENSNPEGTGHVRVPLPGQAVPAVPTVPLPGQAVPAVPTVPLPGQAVPAVPLPGQAVPTVPLPGQAAPAVSPVMPSVPLPGQVAPVRPAAPQVPAPQPAAPAPQPAAPAPQPAAPAPQSAAPVTQPDAPEWEYQPLDLSLISKAWRKHVDPNSPPAVRMMAAKAMVPMGPRDQVHVLYQLTFDATPAIAEVARNSLAQLPERVVDIVAVDVAVAGPVLGLLCDFYLENPMVLERLLLNPSTPDGAFVAVAERVQQEAIIEIVASNQQRLLREQDIVRALKRNPRTIRSTLERVVDFMVRSGVLLRDVPEFAESFSRLNSKEIEAAVEHVEVPFELLSPEDQARARQEGQAPLESAPPTDDGSSDLDLVAAAEEGADEEPASQEKQSIMEQLKTMSVAQQVKIAMKGNKEVRTILLRSTVKMVAEAAIKSPRITEMEVTSCAASRSVQDVVIREISSNREWLRLYPVKVALCNNPKTPMVITMKLLRFLRLTDIKSLAKSKNVPSVISRAAKQLLRTKMG